MVILTESLRFFFVTALVASLEDLVSQSIYLMTIPTLIVVVSNGR